MTNTFKTIGELAKGIKNILETFNTVQIDNPQDTTKRIHIYKTENESDPIYKDIYILEQWNYNEDLKEYEFKSLLDLKYFGRLLYLNRKDLLNKPLILTGENN